MDSEHKPREDPRRLAELSALADGTLDPKRRAEVQARIDASEDLRRRLDEERRAVSLLQTARETDRAPVALRERIDATRAERGRGGPGRAAHRLRPHRAGSWPVRGLRPAGAAALVALVVVLALVLPSGPISAPSIAQAAALGSLGPTGAAPLPQPSDPARLQLASGSLHFPNWANSVGWRPVGQRSDRIGGRHVLTVYYLRGRATVAYSIISGGPLAWPRGASGSSGPYAFRAFRLHDRTVVTWREAGHTCLLSAKGLPLGTLAALIYHA